MNSKLLVGQLSGATLLDSLVGLVLISISFGTFTLLYNQILVADHPGLEFRARIGVSGNQSLDNTLLNHALAKPFIVEREQEPSKRWPGMLEVRTRSVQSGSRVLHLQKNLHRE